MLEFFLLFAILLGFLMAFAIGANDVANSMGTSVGSRALSIKKAVILAGFANFFGAVLVGAQVTQTVRKGILFTDLLPGPESYIVGMLSALIAGSFMLLLATKKSLPISTTHAIVGAILGYGFVSAGISAINTTVLEKIVASWVISPIAGAVLAFIIITSLKKLVLSTNDPVRRAELAVPAATFITILTSTLVIFWKGLPGYFDFSIYTALTTATSLSFITALISWHLASKYHLRHHRHKEINHQHAEIEKIFSYLQILTAATVAFAHGSNDVANAIGPLSGIISAIQLGQIPQNALAPLWILTLGGIGIFAGIAILGYRVIQTIGEKITSISPTTGFSAEIAASIVILIASNLGLPISTTHTLVGSVIGVGLASKTEVKWAKIKEIVASWIFTLPVAAFASIISYFLLTGFFL